MSELFDWHSVGLVGDILTFSLPTLKNRVGDFPAGYDKLDCIKCNLKTNEMTMIDIDGQELATYEFGVVV